MVVVVCSPLSQGMGGVGSGGVLEAFMERVPSTLS